MAGLLTIENINLELLEEQRLILSRSLFKVSQRDGTLALNPKEIDALEGIVNMLDDWSDKQL